MANAASEEDSFGRHNPFNFDAEGNGRLDGGEIQLDIFDHQNGALNPANNNAFRGPEPYNEAERNAVDENRDFENAQIIEEHADRQMIQVVHKGFSVVQTIIISLLLAISMVTIILIALGYIKHEQNTENTVDHELTAEQIDSIGQCVEVMEVVQKILNKVESIEETSHYLSTEFKVQRDLLYELNSVVKNSSTHTGDSFDALFNNLNSSNVVLLDTSLTVQDNNHQLRLLHNLSVNNSQQFDTSILQLANQLDTNRQETRYFNEENEINRDLLYELNSAIKNSSRHTGESFDALFNNLNSSNVVLLDISVTVQDNNHQLRLLHNLSVNNSQRFDTSILQLANQLDTNRQETRYFNEENEINRDLLYELNSAIKNSSRHTGESFDALFNNLNSSNVVLLDISVTVQDNNHQLRLLHNLSVNNSQRFDTSILQLANQLNTNRQETIYLNEEIELNRGLLHELISGVKNSSKHTGDSFETVYKYLNSSYSSMLNLYESLNDNHSQIDEMLRFNLNYSKRIEMYFWDEKSSSSFFELLLENSNTIFSIMSNLSDEIKSNGVELKEFASFHRDYFDVVEHAHDSIETELESSRTMLKNVFELNNRTINDLNKLSNIISSGRYSICESTAVGCLPSNDGWLVLQRRLVFDIAFYKSYTQYENGFGNPLIGGDFWLGLRKLHQLTNNGSTWVMRNDFDSWNNEKSQWVEYTGFSVGDASSGYLLNTGIQTGGSLLDGSGGWKYSDGMKFSAYDADNDIAVENCAFTRKGGWWYEACTMVNLNNLQALNGTDDHTHMEYDDRAGVWYRLKNSIVRIKTVYD